MYGSTAALLDAPWLATGPGLVFALLRARTRRPLALIAATVWLGYLA